LARGFGTLASVRDLDLNDLRVFVRVVDRGRFAIAARELGVPTSTVSRTIARLEATAGTRLLHRTSRSVSVTGEGRAVYASVSEAVGALERAAHALEPATRQPKGVLRVTAAVEIGAAFLADVVVGFGERYPQVQVDLTLTNRVVSLVEEGVDVAVRAATRLPDSSVVARKIGEIDHGLFAAPRYLESRGTPASPADLAAHRCVVFRGTELTKTWKLREDGGGVDVVVRAQTGGDDFGFVRAATVAGGGIALMPRLICAKDEAAGRLVRVLPRFHGKGAGLYVMVPSATHVPSRVTAFRDHVAAAFRAWASSSR
jgi:DNA-binding transcriptional LysR family regulator